MNQFFNNLITFWFSVPACLWCWLRCAWNGLAIIAGSCPWFLNTALNFCWAVCHCFGCGWKLPFRGSETTRSVPYSWICIYFTWVNSVAMTRWWFGWGVRLRVGTVVNEATLCEYAVKSWTLIILILCCFWWFIFLLRQRLFILVFGWVYWAVASSTRCVVA